VPAAAGNSVVEREQSSPTVSGQDSPVATAEVPPSTEEPNVPEADNYGVAGSTHEPSPTGELVETNDSSLTSSTNETIDTAQEAFETNHFSPVGILDKREVEFGKLFAGIKIDDTMLVTVSLPSVSPLSKEDAQTTMRLVEAWMNKVYGTRHGRILLQSENDFITEIEFLDQSVSVDDDGSPICLFRYRQRVSYT